MEYRGTFLPHIQPEYEKFFITFNLRNDIIRQYYYKLKLEKNLQLKKIENMNPDKRQMYKSNIEKKYFGILDDFMGKLKILENYLSIPECADIVVEKLKEYDKIYYDLIAYCIMPNHVHILIDTAIQKKFVTENNKNYVTLGKIMNNIKGASARKINLLVHRRGNLWLRDYYDHYIRNNKEFDNIINYIKLNPVKAGLVSDWEEWKYTYVSKDFI